MSTTVPQQRAQEPLQSQPRNPADTIADPAPLGLAAFAATTFVLSIFNAGLVPVALEPAVLPLALFYGGLAQLLAGMWEFRKTNTFGAVAFTSYGAFWLSFAAYVQFVAPQFSPTEAGVATGLFLLAWTIFTAYMTIAALRVSVAIAAVFIALTATFVVLTIADFIGSTLLGNIGGYLGLLTAALAWYASCAGVVNATWKRTVLPTKVLTPQ